MRRNLLIILAFLPLFALCQTNNLAATYNSSVGQLGGALWYLNTFDIGKVLILKSNSISEDSLTYNSTSDLVTYASIDTVVLDGSSEVVIGNSVKFGSPTGGTIYQILDTLGSSDTLILDQTFTGSVTDEFYWGGVNTWYDESGKGNNATQSVAIEQPKLLWAGTDSVRVSNDGARYMDTPLFFDDQLTWSVSLDVVRYDSSGSPFDFIVGGDRFRCLQTNNSNNFSYREETPGTYHLWNGTGNTTNTTTTELYDGEPHNIIWCSNGVDIYLYLDGESRGYVTPLNTKLYVNSILQGFNKNGTLIPITDYTGLLFWDRTLSEKEIEILSE